jgi:predicted Na+-dependent transporter
MNAAEFVGLGINLSMALMVFGIALTAGSEQLERAFRKPGLLTRSLVAMFGVMPVVAVLIARNFNLNRALLIALMLLALSPVPPILPSKQIKAGGTRPFVLGLLVVTALAAIVVVPAGVATIGRLFGRELNVPNAVVGRVVGLSVLMPVVLGLLGARLLPSLAARLAGPVSKFAGILLLVSFVPALWAAWGGIAAQMNNFTVLAIVAFIAVGLAAGHWLGGPDPDDRTALALATATRHPGVAIAVLHVIEPGNEDITLVVLLYLLVGMVATIPYVRWRTRASSVRSSTRN